MRGPSAKAPPLRPPAPSDQHHFDQTEGNFAFQAIGGLSFPIPGVPGLSVTSEYRFFGVPGSESFAGTQVVAGVPAPVPVTLRPQHQFNHSFLLGVRYAFNVASPVPVPPPQAAPAPAAARSYLVFFDWDKATLTDRARQIIKEAADNSTRVQYTRIEVNGYTDTSGTHQYNQGLSVRRAQAVQAELIKDGVPQGVIGIQGFGDTQLLVRLARVFASRRTAGSRSSSADRPPPPWWCLRHSRHRRGASLVPMDCVNDGFRCTQPILRVCESW